MIYVVTSPSGKQYVGQARQVLSNGMKWGLYQRWKSHVREALTLQNHCYALDNAIRKYGHDSFKVELICACSSFTADATESYYIKHLSTLAPKGYNLRCQHGDSDYTRERKSIAHFGKQRPTDVNSKISVGQIGNRRCKKNRQCGEDHDLPKYVVAIRRKGYICGYCVKSFPIGTKVTGKQYAPYKSFQSSLLSLDENKQLAISYLKKLQEQYHVIDQQSQRVVCSDPGQGEHVHPRRDL